nr:hypothetical protein [Mycobacterium stomatepiae]
MDTSLAFYTAALGIDVIFDVELEGAGLDAVTGGAAQKGRMVGGLIGGAMVELLFLGDVPAAPPARTVATPISRFASPTSTRPTRPCGASTPRCTPSRWSISAVYECFSFMTRMTRRLRFSSCRVVPAPRWNSGGPAAKTLRPKRRNPGRRGTTAGPNPRPARYRDRRRHRRGATH